MNNVSLILPCKNDEPIIFKNLKNLVNYLKNTFLNFEIFVISNGSSDDNLAYLSKISKLDNNIYCHYLKKSGKGRAVRYGLNNAKFNLVIIFDSDFAYDFNDISKLTAENYNLFPFIVGTRISNNLQHTSKLRILLGLTYNKLFNIFFNKNIPDTQAGFKLININLFPQAKNFKLNNFSYDAELVLLASKFNIKVKRIPVEIKNKFGKSSVRIFSTPIRMFIDLIYLKFKY